MSLLPGSSEADLRPVGLGWPRGKPWAPGAGMKELFHGPLGRDAGDARQAAAPDHEMVTGRVGVGGGLHSHPEQGQVARMPGTPDLWGNKVRAPATQACLWSGLPRRYPLL